MDSGIFLVALLMCAAEPAAKSDHWSFQPVKNAPTPAVKNESWPRDDLDRFVLAKLEEASLAPSPEADRTALIRRLTFDLIGLPPTPEEIDRFTNDPRPDAYDRVVDRLLASPHYGERQAQHWLDLVRYADTDGFEYDQARPEMWRYRDWVVAAFQADLPFDQFLKRQLAGDELAPEDPASLIATGFHRLGPDMVDLNDQGLRRQNTLNEITETTSLVFLGLTMGCARCHDHKYDPISQRDFYTFQSFFAGTQFCDDIVIAPPEERIAHEKKLQEWTREVGRARANLIRIETPVREKLHPDRPAGLRDETARALAKPESARNVEDVRLVFEFYRSDSRTPLDQVVKALDAQGQIDHRRWEDRLSVLMKNPPPALARARAVSESSGEPPPTYLLKRGDYTNRGVEVSPAFPAVFGSESTTITATKRRSSLAQWLTRPDHPLTARVFVNRAWQTFMGRGLVATPNDFGIMGEEPTHPELLDRLAADFVRSDWSVKTLHRRLVRSATYRQSAKFDGRAARIDPENRLLWRHTRTRLEGEAIRDAMLACSRRLNLALGGPCVYPELPTELTRLSSKGLIWPVSPQEKDRNRRSLYVFLRRNLRFPLFEAFDKPDTNASCPRRSVTTVAPQSLVLLNGNLTRDCARAMAARLTATTSGDRASVVKTAYRIALGRQPDESEIRMATEFLKEGSPEEFCQALFNSNEFVYID